jgi:hypothetical protein
MFGIPIATAWWDLDMVVGESAIVLWHEDRGFPLLRRSASKLTSRVIT